MATNSTQQSDSRNSQSNETYNGILNDTQFIPLSKSGSFGQASENTRLDQIRLLSENEENRIIDSSCDFKDSISTQALLDKEPDTVVIKEHIPINNNSEANQDGSLRLSPSKSSAPFKNLKLPDGDSPWLSKVNDPFEESQTPWLNKIKDPFKETPVNNKRFDGFDKTPNSAKRLIDNSLDTPSAAHKVFQRLRESNDKKELEFDSQTIPEMFRDTQPILDDATQEININAQDDTINDTTTNDDTNELEPTKKDPTSPSIPTQILNDTVNIDANVTHENGTNESELKSDNTQADIQVLGTAPEPEVSTDVEDSVLANDTVISQIDNNNGSSPINSDAEEENFTLDLGRRLHSEPVAGNYLNILAEDSIQKYHRDLNKRVVDHINNDSIPNSKSFTNDTLQISQGKRLNSLPSKLENDTIFSHSKLQPLHDAQKFSQKSNSLHPYSATQNKSQETSSPKVEESSPAIRDKIDTFEIKDYRKDNTQGAPQSQNVELNQLAENITQEFSDVDDESKLEHTLMAVEDAKKQPEQEEAFESSAKIRRSSRRIGAQISFTSSPEKSFNESVVLDANTSEIGDDDYEVSVNGDQESPEPENKEFPTEILREETRDLTESDILFKNSVWFFDGSKYYPGVIVGLGETGLNVKFFESTNEVSDGLFPLDVQIGDHIKLDRSSYIVTGLECVISDDVKDVIRCMRGYDTVLVKKLKGHSKRKKSVGNEIKFPLGEIKVENEDWHSRPRELGEVEIFKSKRSLSKKSKTRKRLHPATYQEDLILSSTKKPKVKSSDIFSGCIFVFTGDVDKDSLSDKILSNGGYVLEEGFASQIKFKNGLPTSELFEGYNFSAIISKKCLRSSKYLETVALGWPLLYQDFITDCIAENQLIEKVNPYLLPSGESSMMCGGPKSADITLFVEKWKLGYKLSEQLTNNTILKDTIVLICSKKNEDITSFMFNILGSKEVVFFTLTNYTNFMNKITPYLSKGKILIYHDKISVIQSTLSTSGKTVESRGKKSRKGSILSEIKSDPKRDIHLELIDWEWLVQCIISGHAWKSKHQWTKKS